MHDAGLILSGVIAPIAAIWFDYPIQIPIFDPADFQKIFIILLWFSLIGFLYYRTKINEVYEEHAKAKKKQYSRPF